MTIYLIYAFATALTGVLFMICFRTWELKMGRVKIHATASRYRSRGEREDIIAYIIRAYGESNLYQIFYKIYEKRKLAQRNAIDMIKKILVLLNIGGLKKRKKEINAITPSSQFFKSINDHKEKIRNKAKMTN